MPPKRVNRRLRVYFIRAGTAGPVKIGLSFDVRERLRHLQSANHERLHLIRSILGSRPKEKWLHDRFTARGLALGGEWFRFHYEMLSVRPPRTVGEKERWRRVDRAFARMKKRVENQSARSVSHERAA